MISDYEGKLKGGASVVIGSDFFIWDLFKAATYTDNTAAIAAKVRTRFLAGLENLLESYQFWVSVKKKAGTFSSPPPCI